LRSIALIIPDKIWYTWYGRVHICALYATCMLYATLRVV
jgi:hypothetical protein